MSFINIHHDFYQNTILLSLCPDVHQRADFSEGDAVGLKSYLGSAYLNTDRLLLLLVGLLLLFCVQNTKYENTFFADILKYFACTQPGSIDWPVWCKIQYMSISPLPLPKMWNYEQPLLAAVCVEKWKRSQSQQCWQELCSVAQCWQELRNRRWKEEALAWKIFTPMCAFRVEVSKKVKSHWLQKKRLWAREDGKMSAAGFCVV